eukprot:1000214-Rhodomonas_salina.5
MPSTSLADRATAGTQTCAGRLRWSACEGRTTPPHACPRRAGSACASTEPAPAPPPPAQPAPTRGKGTPTTPGPHRVLEVEARELCLPRVAGDQVRVLQLVQHPASARQEAESTSIAPPSAPSHLPRRSRHRHHPHWTPRHSCRGCTRSEGPSDPRVTQRVRRLWVGRRTAGDSPVVERAVVLELEGAERVRDLFQGVRNAVPAQPRHTATRSSPTRSAAVEDGSARARCRTYAKSYIG